MFSGILPLAKYLKTVKDLEKFIQIWDMTMTRSKVPLPLPASTMAGLLLAHTDSTLSTRDVVHSNFS